MASTAFRFLGVLISLLLPNPGYTVEDDHDADGVPAVRDNCPGIANPLQTDSDRDGLGNHCDNCPDLTNRDQFDQNGDGEGDACDSDDDGDLTPDSSDCLRLSRLGEIMVVDRRGRIVCVVDDEDDDDDRVLDTEDNCPLFGSADQTDPDHDRIGNPCDPDDDGDGRADEGDNCPLQANPDQADNDADGEGNPCDKDDDNDLRNDTADNCPFSFNPDQRDRDRDGRGDACDDDSDGDGVGRRDNCPRVANADQTDTDRDRRGNACDADDDNDRRNDPVDNCPLVANPDQADLDGDLLGNLCDPDPDGDGISDTDSCPVVSNADQINTDADDLGDACDNDDDNDGVIDSTDNCPLSSNGSQADTDGDGIGDLCDVVSASCSPSGLRATIFRCNNLQLEWSLNPTSCGTTEYRIDRDGTEWGRRGAAIRYFQDRMTLPSSTHEYRVVALDASGVSQGEGTLAVTTPACLPPPPVMNTKVLYFRFSDFPEEFTLPDGTLVNNAFFDNIVFTSPTGSLNTYLNEVSYNQTGVSGEVYGPYTLPRDPSEYCPTTLPSGMHQGCSLSLIRADALAVVDPLIDFMGTDLVILAINGLTGGYAAGAFFTSEDTDNYFIVIGSSHYSSSPGFANPTLVHELGHQIGNLLHAGAWRCPAGSGPGPDLNDLLAGGCSVERYGDAYSSMGVNSFHYNAWHKELIGFLSRAQITTVPDAPGVYEYTIDALEVVSSGIKEVKIPVGGGHFYFLEYRKPIGMDAWATPLGWRPIRDAVQIRLKVARIQLSDSDTYTVPPNNGVISVGLPFEDTYRGLHVELLENSIGPDGMQARVRVTRTAVP